MLEFIKVEDIMTIKNSREINRQNFARKQTPCLKNTEIVREIRNILHEIYTKTINLDNKAKYEKIHSKKKAGEGK